VETTENFYGTLGGCPQKHCFRHLMFYTADVLKVDYLVDDENFMSGI
jgi:hypothetical protein